MSDNVDISVNTKMESWSQFGETFSIPQTIADLCWELRANSFVKDGVRGEFI